MTVEPGPITSGWLVPVCDAIARCGAGEALAVRFPAYRPDLVAVLARRLGAAHVDFRQQRLVPLGWNASSVPLSALAETALGEMDEGRDVILHNAEALLALCAPAARRQWFADTMARSWPRRLILPVVLYAADLPDSAHDRIFDLEAGQLPPESLLDLLPNLQ